MDETEFESEEWVRENFSAFDFCRGWDRSKIRDPQLKEQLAEENRTGPEANPN
jgi:hypothetical protein